MGIASKTPGLFCRKRQVLEKKAELIGIAGSGRSVGTTHFAILTANYLAGVLRQKTAVLEWNKSGDFARMETVWAKKTVIFPQGKTFNVLGISYYKEAGKEELLDCSNRGFDVVVLDFGAYREEIRDEYLRCGRKFLVGSASGWQFAELTGLLSESGIRQKGWEYFFSFGSRETIKMTERYLKVPFRRIPLSPDAFSITGEHLAFYGKFLK